MNHNLDYKVFPVDEAPVPRLADQLAGGNMAILGPSTVYALTADAANESAVGKIYRIKNRPSHNPIMVMVHDIDAARSLVELSPIAEQLAERFWPGPLTLSLPIKPGKWLAPQCMDTSGYVAVCVHDAPIENRILEQLGRPLACSSANQSGWLAPTRIDHIPPDMMSPMEWILDGGPTKFGLETTLIRADGDDLTLVRPGPIGREALKSVLGERSLVDTPIDHGSVVTTEALPHYDAGLDIRLNAREAEPGETLLDFGATLNAAHDLSPAGDLQEAARSLYALLHDLQRAGCQRIAVAPIPNDGIGAAINHRLRNAARTRSDRQGANS